MLLLFYINKFFSSFKLDRDIILLFNNSLNNDMFFFLVVVLTKFRLKRLINCDVKFY